MRTMMKYHLMTNPELYDRVFKSTSDVDVTLPLDVRTDGDDYVVMASVPGLRAEDVSVEVLGQRVAIRGEIPAIQIDEKSDWLMRERATGRFARTLKFPVELDGSKAEAAVENGVLTLRLPQAETAKPKQIKVLAK